MRRVLYPVEQQHSRLGTWASTGQVFPTAQQAQAYIDALPESLRARRRVGEPIRVWRAAA